MKKERLYINKYHGFSLIEVLLTTAIFSILAVALVGVLSIGEEASVLGGNRAQAALLAEEGLEAVRNIRDENFANLTDGSYGLAKISNEWQFIPAPEVNGIYDRIIDVSTIDANTKSVVSRVAWRQNLQRTGEVILNTYLTNWK